MAHLANLFVFKSLYKIHWSALGSPSSPPVILIHGTPFNSSVWLPYASALQQKYHVYLYDLAGFGQSQEITAPDRPDWDVSYALQAELFVALYRHWGFHDTNQPHVVAHDIGGHTALRAQVMLDLRYASLCLIDAVAVTPWGSPFMRAVMNHSEPFEQVPTDVFEGMLKEYVNSATYYRLRDHQMEALIGPWVRRGEEGKRAFLRQIRWADWGHTEEQEQRYDGAFKGSEQRGKRLKIIWAENDAWLPVERGEKLHAMTGAREFVRVPEAGHLVLLDQPERIMFEIIDWLAQMCVDSNFRQSK